jgi:hypothetical protein
MRHFALLVLLLPALAATLSRVVGGMSPVDPAAPEVAAAAAAVAAAYDGTTAESAPSTAATVVGGTQQVVSGMKFVLDVLLAPCAPGAAPPCAPAGAPAKRVSATVWAQPWLGAPKVTLHEVRDAN